MEELQCTQCNDKTQPTLYSKNMLVENNTEETETETKKLTYTEHWEYHVWKGQQKKFNNIRKQKEDIYQQEQGNLRKTLRYGVTKAMSMRHDREHHSNIADEWESGVRQIRKAF